MLLIFEYHKNALNGLINKIMAMNLWRDVVPRSNVPDIINVIVEKVGIVGWRTASEARTVILNA